MAIRKSVFGVIAASTFLTAMAPATANAAAFLITDKFAFLSMTGATSATGPIPIGPERASSLTVGSVTFSTDSPSTLNFSRDWTTRIDGNQFALNDMENLDVSFGSDVFNVGFDFVEPELDPTGATFFDSIFEISLCNGGTCFDMLRFEAPNDIAHFIGIISNMSFDTIFIREIFGGTDNEFFGEFYTSATRVDDPDPIPLPAAAPLFLAGLIGGGLTLRKRRKAGSLMAGD